MFGKDYMMGKKLEIPVSDNLKVSLTDRCNVKNMILDPANS